MGSGGATLSVIRYIYEQEKIKCGHGHFDNFRILVIHSGGDSKRVPTYSALGKLFSPVPHKLQSGGGSGKFSFKTCRRTPAKGRMGADGVVKGFEIGKYVVLCSSPCTLQNGDHTDTGTATLSWFSNNDGGSRSVGWRYLYLRETADSHLEMV